ncbi:MAG: 50S rRNA methyltransferase [Candidatus Marinimicrobia bacterium]|nr:50S rRNA methyltransferase [Candidatus Neomarinimicrobiota bacterium]|tara:strand:+ start:1827 stop:2417 length:591 start_codon:yes stop_codon:yes gene_type:complete
MDNKSYQDHFFKKAKRLGYRSRSAFKLIELNEKFKFLKNSINLLDLGSYPGGWCQVAKNKNKNGKILGLDKKLVDEIKGIKIIKGDFLDPKLMFTVQKYFDSGIDVILSDMAADTTGNKSLDCIRTNQLCLEVLKFAKNVLKSNGVVVSKVFMGEDFEEVKDIGKNHFKKINFFKPKSSRNESKETYIHCVGLNAL